MTKQFCDVCGKEKDRLNRFAYLCHIDTILDGTLGYVDSDFNAVSGRTVEKDLCNSCYNTVVIQAVKKMREMHEKEKEA